MKQQTTVPALIRVLGVDIAIELKQLNEPDKNRDGHFLFGQYLADREIIELEETMPPHILLPTLLHELLEAVNSRCELNLKHNQIMTLESALYQIMVDNPGLPTLFEGDS